MLTSGVGAGLRLGGVTGVTGLLEELGASPGSREVWIVQCHRTMVLPVGRGHHVIHTPGLDLEAVDPELDAVRPGVPDGGLPVLVHELRVAVRVLQEELHHPGVAPSAGDHQGSGAARGVP